MKNIKNKIKYIKLRKQKLFLKAKNVGIGAHKKVVHSILNKKVKKGDVAYVASTPQSHDYGGFRANTTRAYVWNGNDFELLFSNLSNHRAKIAIKNYKKYKSGKIDSAVWDNYITNGYSTRAGLFRSKNINRMKLMAKSHADYLGGETGNSKYDHYNRVKIRRG